MLDLPLFYETNPMCVFRDQEPCRSCGRDPESPKVLPGVPSGEYGAQRSKAWCARQILCLGLLSRPATERIEEWYARRLEI
jgi:hypothetical protein